MQKQQQQNSHDERHLFIYFVLLNFSWQSLFGFVFDSGDDTDNGSSDDDDDDDDTSNSDDEGKTKFKNSARPKDETADDKRLRKQAVKDAKTEKRKNKLPKHLKKRKEKQNTKKKWISLFDV